MKELDFSKVQMFKTAERFRSLLFLNSNFDLKIIHDYFGSQLPELIAADGAAWKMQALGLLPQIICGDLDSLKSRQDWNAVFNKSEIISLPDQETNDFEKALRLIQDRKLDPCLVTGLQGGDLEHSFNNWSIFIKFCSQFELVILEADRLGIAVSAGRQLKVSCGPQSLVSLIPQPSAVITTSGLQWSLNSELLELGNREGARNVAILSEFSICIESGSVLVFVPLDAVWKIE